MKTMTDMQLPSWAPSWVTCGHETPLQPKLNKYAESRLGLPAFDCN